MMKTAKDLVILAVLAFATTLAPGAGAQVKPPEAPANKTAKAPMKTTAKAQVHKASPAGRPAAQAKTGKVEPGKAGPAAQSVAQAKPPKIEHRKASAAVRPAAKAKPAKIEARNAEPKPQPEKLEAVISKRDPFTPLVSVPVAGGGGPQNLPPGKAGLVVATVRVDGAVVAPSGLIAVVSNPQDRVYFIREGDRLYDGDVEKISLDGVTFKENSKDAFGNPVERLVTKRIYPNAGEQQ